MILKAQVLYNCSPQFYLEQYFHEANRRKRELEGCGTVDYKVLESTRDGGVWHHLAESIERLNAPGPIRKLFGETSRFEEDATWKEGTNVLQVIYRPDTMQKKISIRGTMTAQDQGNGTCQVTAEIEFKVSIFGIGGLIEKMAAKEMPTHLQKDADYFNAHLAPT